MLFSTDGDSKVDTLKQFYGHMSNVSLHRTGSRLRIPIIQLLSKAKKKDTFPFLECFQERIIDYPSTEKILQLIFPKRLKAGFARNSTRVKTRLKITTATSASKWKQ